MHMKKLISVVVILGVSCLPVLGKDKPKITIQVVDSNNWQRQFDVHHGGTASQTNCDTNGNTNGTITDSSVYATTNATTNCTTKPGSPAYTTHGYIAQNTTHAIMPDGTHVMLWCQAGFRKCSNLAPGTYQAEADGDNALRVYVYSLVTHKPQGKLKYHVTGTW
jgi:hypothetical protein